MARSARPAAARRPCARLVKQLRPDPLRDTPFAGIVARAEGNAFFVEELVGAAWMSGRRRARRPRRAPRWSGSTGSSETAQQVVRTASVSGRRVSTRCYRGRRCREASSTRRCARPSAQLLVPRATDYYRSGTPCGRGGLRDLLPGERVRMHGAYVDASPPARQRRPPPSSPGTRAVARDLGRRRSTPASRPGDEAMAVGGPDEAADHYQTALELLSDPAARERGPGRHRTARVSGGPRADRFGPPGARDLVLRELLDGLADDWPVEQRGRLLIAMANAVMVDENRLDPLEFTDAAFDLVSDEPTPLRALLLSVHARAHALPRQRRAGPGVRRRGADPRRDPGPPADRHRRADHPRQPGREGPYRKTYRPGLEEAVRRSPRPGSTTPS